MKKNIDMDNKKLKFLLKLKNLLVDDPQSVFGSFKDIILVLYYIYLFSWSDSKLYIDGGIDWM